MSNYKKIINSIKFPKNCPGINWKSGREDGDFDKEIIPLLKVLNSFDFCHTTGSCAGHSLNDVKKYQKGWMVEAPYRITISIHVKHDSINKFIEIVNQMHSASNSDLWCELGFFDDLNNKTEKDYIPFEIIVFARTKKRRDSLIKIYTSILKEYS